MSVQRSIDTTFQDEVTGLTVQAKLILTGDSVAVGHVGNTLEASLREAMGPAGLLLIRRQVTLGSDPGPPAVEAPRLPQDVPQPDGT